MVQVQVQVQVLPAAGLPPAVAQVAARRHADQPGPQPRSRLLDV